jgi:hypothetical protein
MQPPVVEIGHVLFVEYQQTLIALPDLTVPEFNEVFAKGVKKRLPPSSQIP